MYTHTTHIYIYIYIYVYTYTYIHIYIYICVVYVGRALPGKASADLPAAAGWADPQDTYSSRACACVGVRVGFGGNSGFFGGL